MNREAALLGTVAYTVFVGRLAAVDAELIRRGLLHDLRDPATEVRFAKRVNGTAPTASGAAAILALIDAALEQCTR
jgi:predicted glycosyltransferase